MSNKMPNISLIKQALLTKAASNRQSTAHTKTRGKVSGGGAKPWRQKGTGRARAGSRRSPIWVGGGIVFGPSKERNFKTRLPHRMQQAAFLELLNWKKSNDQIVSVASLAMKEVKTKAAITLLKNNEIGSDEPVLLVTEKIEPELALSTNNLRNVNLRTADSLSLADLADGRRVLMEKKVFSKYFPSEEKPSSSKSKKSDKKA